MSLQSTPGNKRISLTNDVSKSCPNSILFLLLLTADMCNIPKVHNHCMGFRKYYHCHFRPTYDFFLQILCVTIYLHVAARSFPNRFHNLWDEVHAGNDDLSTLSTRLMTYSHPVLQPPGPCPIVVPLRGMRPTCEIWEVYHAVETLSRKEPEMVVTSANMIQLLVSGSIFVSYNLWLQVFGILHCV